MLAAMFTGLVQAVGEVVQSRDSAAGRRLVVAASGWEHRPGLGDSISVSGCCLTVAEISASPGLAMAFDVVSETLAKTTIGGLAVGSRVNLEHAVRADTLMGGHFVQGHVDGVGRVTGLKNDPADWRVAIELSEPLREFIAPKGSVAVEGVSLTVAEVTPTGFEVVLIPVTLAKTTLAGLAVGDGCNIECDILAKQVVYWVKKYQRGERS